VTFLALPQPFDFELTTERFRAFGLDRANYWEDDALFRAVGGREVRIVAAPGGVDVEPLDAETEPVVALLLGLPFDLDAFAAWAAGDEVLAEVVPRLAGFRPSLGPDPFESLVGTVISQQVSLQSARAIRNRLVEQFGVSVGRAWTFPSRERIASTDDAGLLACGFSRAKAAYVLGIARSDLDFASLAALPDDEVKARLTELRGVGEWTADWYLARHLARPHAWPWGDLVLRKAVAALYGGIDAREARERFHPHENLSAHYLLLAQRTP
jgi:3-methyladenine DNA glycosylase/8-oxoguanine DNA glycosylase